MSSQVSSLTSLASLPYNAATSLAWGPLVLLARNSVCSLFSRLEVGLLTIKDVDGTTRFYGDQALVQQATSSSSGSSEDGSSCAFVDEPVQATLIVRSDQFWVRMFFGADLGFSEAFMAREVDTPTLGDCFDVRAERKRPCDHDTSRCADLASTLLARRSSSFTIDLRSLSLTWGPPHASQDGFRGSSTSATLIPREAV